MNNYVTGAVIKRLRENKKMTQDQLAQKIFVTSKAVCKWETGTGFLKWTENFYNSLS